MWPHKMVEDDYDMVVLLLYCLPCIDGQMFAKGGQVNQVSFSWNLDSWTISMLNDVKIIGSMSQCMEVRYDIWKGQMS